MRNIIYVDPKNSKTWSTKILGEESSENKFREKIDAVRYAKKMARIHDLDIVVRRKDGIFQFRNY